MIGRFLQSFRAQGDAVEEGSLTPSDNEPLAAEVYHDAARHFIDVQISTMDVLDTKTSQYFSIGSLVLPVTFALLSLGSGNADTVSTGSRWSLVFALVFYVLVLGFATAASLIRGLEYRPDIATLKRHSETYSGALLKQWVANEYEASIAQNKDVLVRKARWVGAEALALYFEGLFLSIAAVVTLLL